MLIKSPSLTTEKKSEAAVLFWGILQKYFATYLTSESAVMCESKVAPRTIVTYYIIYIPQWRAVTKPEVTIYIYIYIQQLYYGLPTKHPILYYCCNIELCNTYLKKENNAYSNFKRHLIYVLNYNLLITWPQENTHFQTKLLVRWCDMFSRSDKSLKTHQS